MNRLHSNSIAARRAFTLIELLVVISIIALLTALLAVAFSGALGAGKKSATQSLMRNIQTGLQQFEQDFGYLPPLLDGHKHSLDSIPDPTTRAEELELHRYHSLFSLSVYLLGVGDLAPNPEAFAEGEAPDRHDGVAGPGIRDPGPDRSWGGARERDNHNARTSGRVYGPYIDIGDGTDVLRRVRLDDYPFLLSASDPSILKDPMVVPDFFPYEYAMEDGVLNPVNAEGDLFVIVDPWGTPIRYYKDWPTRTLIGSGTNFQTSPNRIPIELRSHESVIQHLTSPLSGGRGGDPLLDPDVLRAPYALLSAGSDQLFGDYSKDADAADYVDDLNRVESDQLFNSFSSGTPTGYQKLNFLETIKDNIRTFP